MKRFVTLAAAALLAVAAGCAPLPSPQTAMPQAAMPLSYRLVHSLTTEVGPRLAGTPQEAAARDWAVRTLKELKFSRVSVEPFTFDGWVRGPERATIVSHGDQALAVTALGGSVSTQKGGITAPVAFVASFDDLLAAPPGTYKGKIAFVNDRMTATLRATRSRCASGARGRARRRNAARLRL